MKMYRESRCGFSAVELIVVSLLVGLAALLLLSVLSKVRERAEGTGCVNRLRQMGIAIQSYCADHRGQILPTIEEDPENPSLNLSGTFWHNMLRRKGYFGPPPDESTSARRIMVNKAGSHFCPSLPSAGGNEESYGMRRWRSPGKDDWNRHKPMAQINELSRFFLLIDSYKPQKKTQGYFVSPGSTAYRIHLAHQGRANALFADGHVASLSREEIEALAAEQTAYFNSLPFSFGPETSSE